MIPLLGYADRLSVRPGGRIGFKVSNATGAPVTTRLVRVVSADPNPAGPGIIEDAVALPIVAVREATPQQVPLGSCAVVDMQGRLAALGSFRMTLLVSPGNHLAGAQTLISWRDEAARTGVAVALDDMRLAVGGFLSDGQAVRIATGIDLAARAWTRITVDFDEARHRLDVTATPLTAAGDGRPLVRTTADVRLAPASTAPLIVGALSPPVAAPASEPFNGRIEAPSLLAGASGGDGVIASWDFAREMTSDRIVDTGPHGLHGRLLNLPMRAVTGARWSGREMCWRNAPEEYAAIHFHADDLADCGWPTTHEIRIPPDLRSGTYALRLEAGDAAENIPFFVVPPAGKPTARVAVLVSTYTYVVYANHARPEALTDEVWRNRWMARTAAWGGYPHNPSLAPEVGRSTYNYHPDGTGISLSTSRRPMLNVRIGYVTYCDERHGSGLRHFPADTHLTAWLEARGQAYDIITDDELHREGASLLAAYPVVMTGSHPEYHTREMLDALEAYRDGGGRLMYLGGNGFYWKIAVDDRFPGVIEIRRAEGGLRAWASEPGEYYHQLDGEYGGLWRRNARPPQRLVGVGFTAQGQFVGGYYRKTAAADDPRAAWMFAGIEGDVIGDFGLSGGGAAGFELDRADERLGTPADALVVARSEGHPKEDWILTHEEQLTHITTIPGGRADRHIHADMTIFPVAGGGAVFSVGSITFCGSLPWNGFDNSVSRLVGNVLARFLDPAPLA